MSLQPGEGIWHLCSPMRLASASALSGNNSANEPIARVGVAQLGGPGWEQGTAFRTTGLGSDHPHTTADARALDIYDRRLGNAIV
jgi:hypothetical protein